MRKAVLIKKAAAKMLAVFAVAAAGILFAGGVKTLAGDIFTRESTKLSYPAVRTIAVKTDYLDKKIQYFTSDHSVAMVAKNGEIMTVGEGKCTIYARCENGVTDTCEVTVEPQGVKHRQVALTYDDGPGGYGQELLDFLKDRGVHVTFFYIGNQVSSYSENVKRAYNEGHEIGNHSFTHPQLDKLELEKLKKELDNTNNAIFKACGTMPTVFRPPYGAKNSTVVEEANLPCILWSVDTLDWKYKDANRVCDEVCKGAYDGAVILVHEIHKTTIKGTMAAIDKLLAEGVEFVTVSELWSRDSAGLQNGSVYGRKK